VDFLIDGPEDAPATVLLAHGAGAPMDSGSMSAIAAALAAEGLRVARFEFGDMAARRSGQRRPPPRAETLIPEYCAAVAALGARPPLLIGGKSMGGRVASLVADESGVAGLLCLGYPFHPVGQPDKLRTAHLRTLATPALVVQGERDPFGTRAEVATYDLAPTIEIAWLPDGDHSWAPRKASGRTVGENLAAGVAAAVGWLEGR
jgi:predicted alpha/beta-hydrolase family hydrolase